MDFPGGYLGGFRAVGFFAVEANFAALLHGVGDDFRAALGEHV